MTVSQVMTVSKGKLLETLPKWGRLYTVEADITVNKLPSASAVWANIFHFTINKNIGTNGDRIPLVLVNKDKYFYISTDLNGKVDKGTFKFNFDMYKKYHLKIEQFQKDGKIMYQVMINGKTEYSAENTDPKDFENVKVFASDPWHDAFTSEYGILENFKYSRPVEGKQITENILKMDFREFKTKLRFKIVQSVPG